ncbi:MAG TPA: PqqD family protein [Dongiaceae bacterium]|nr:PqqD family protein [Dongiaceae bacterium]
MNHRPTPDTILATSPDVVARQVAGEHLLVPVRRGVAEMDYLYTADPAGSFIWSCLDGRRSLGAVARLVAEAFEVDEPRALADVLAFAAELGSAGLVRNATDAP